MSTVGMVSVRFFVPSACSWLAGLVLGGDETIIGELVAAGIPLATSAYSRRFEEEADGFAALLLARGGGSPDHLAQALEALRAKCGDKCPDGQLAFHPPFDGGSDSEAA